MQATQSVDVLSRREFMQEFSREWYANGQHLTMIGPTQRGKTTLSHQLLSVTISPERPAHVLAGKPPHRDPVMANAAKRLNLRIVDEWPPNWNPRDRKRNGYVLRPEHAKLEDETRANLRKHFRACMIDSYNTTKRPVILVVDEAHHIQNTYRLRDEYEAPLMRGAPHCAVWSLIQRGRFMTYLVYDAPDHFFVYADPDQNNRKRYSEMGGVDPKFLMQLQEGLKTETIRHSGGEATISECIYVRRSGPFICIVGTA